MGVGDWRRINKIITTTSKNSYWEATEILLTWNKFWSDDVFVRARWGRRRRDLLRNDPKIRGWWWVVVSGTERSLSPSLVLKRALFSNGRWADCAEILYYIKDGFPPLPLPSASASSETWYSGFDHPYNHPRCISIILFYNVLIKLDLYRIKPLPSTRLHNCL